MAGLEGIELKRYYLEKIIGQGGFGTVYKAFNSETKKAAAIKVLSPAISGERHFIRRFRREAGLASKLNHPNIVPVLDYDEHRGLVYLVMPYLEHGSLKTYLKKRSVPFEEFTSWFIQVADGLAHAHSLGIVHRDVKPGNILIDDTGSARLTDFGLARLAESYSTLTGSNVIGTPAYISPEQARSAEVDALSDQYSLGVILYEIHAGRVPFQAKTAVDVILQHLNKQVPLPRKFNPHIPEVIERVILTSLEKDPSRRFASVSDLKSAYERALKGDPLEDLDATMTPLRLPLIQRGWLDKLNLSGEERKWFTRMVFIALLFAGPIIYFGFRNGEDGSSNLQVPTAIQEETPLGDLDLGFEATMNSDNQIENPKELVVNSENCPGLRMFNFNVQGSEAAWLIDNGYESEVELANLRNFVPPDPDQEIRQIQLGDEIIYQRSDNMTAPSWIDGTDRSIAPGEAKPLIFNFEWAIEPTGYRLNLDFQPNCSLEGNW